MAAHMFRKYSRYIRRYPIPIWAGLATIGALQFRRILQKPVPDPLPEEMDHDGILVLGYKSLPLKSLSSLWGRLNEVTLPEWLRPILLGAYARVYRCNLEEAVESDLKKYKNLGEFFRRRLRPEVRPVDKEHDLVSPCDGRLVHFGEVPENGYLEAVKGVYYPLKRFLGFLPDIKNRSSLYYYVIYLAPGDYHGFHSPVSWDIKDRTHFNGHLLSVGPKITRRVPNLFCVNERVLYTGSWRKGFFSFCAIGATNVGTIRVPFDPSLQTNCNSDPNEKASDKINLDGCKLKKGDFLGEFNLGSCIVIVFESDNDVQFNGNIGEKIKMGQGLVKLKKS